LFGTTQFGGSAGDGIAYELKASSGAYVENVLYSFPAAQAAPTWALEGEHGDVFVPTFNGGVHFNGTIAELRREPGRGYIEAKDFGFDGTDGSDPINGLLEQNGTIYTATAGGGLYGDGCIVALSEATLQATDVYDFSGPDGAYPSSPLVADSSGALYGTTRGTGPVRTWGTVYRFVPSGNRVSLTTLWRFSGPGLQSPAGSIALDRAGNLYGSAAGWLRHGRHALPNVNGYQYFGIIYRLAPGNGGYSLTPLYTLPGSAYSGFFPTANLALLGGTLYGVSAGAGKYSSGTLFRLSTSGEGYSDLYDFQIGGDGFLPVGLTASRGALYGTTTYGGTGGGGGTIFRYVP
jgi:hypothetical protein